ncbi:ankyrin repeat domain-containing protein 17-like [Sycon ciliatum]|uniref:ankyrin repeat domain-containing protein 17-like n=1 Tax=Sycon ciliatum TaxID=27933 RepID=UPI0020AC9963|eukprot:scpid70703/ scgid24943/ Ankyrin-2; Brain ankyrin
MPVKIPWFDVAEGFQHAGGHAPIRVCNAWQQRPSANPDQPWQERDGADTLHTWASFFLTLANEDVTSLETFCQSHDGGLQNFMDAFDEGGFFALHVCAALGLGEAMTVLLENGFDPEIECVHDKKIGLWDEVSDVITRGVRPLHLAAKYGHAGIVKVLLARGVDVHAQATTCQGELERKVTSLQIAAVEGQLAAAEVLLDHGADVTSDGCYGPAEVCGGMKFARMLIDRGQQVGESAVAKMLMNVANTSWRGRPRSEVVEAAERILELMADLRVKPSRTCLPVFLRNGSIPLSAMTEIVLLLALYGANISSENGALLVAAYQGKEDLVRLMFQLGWNAGGSVRTLHSRSSHGRAGQGLAMDMLVMDRLPHVAVRARERVDKAAELLAEASATVPSLQVWCRWAILAALQDPRKVSELPVTPIMKSFIVLRRERRELLQQEYAYTVGSAHNT